MKHNLYFYTEAEARNAMVVIRHNFTPRVETNGRVLAFSTPYVLRDSVQTSISRSINSCDSNFNLAELKNEQR